MWTSVVNKIQSFSLTDLGKVKFPLDVPYVNSLVTSVGTSAGTTASRKVQ